MQLPRSGAGCFFWNLNQFFQAAFSADYRRIRHFWPGDSCEESNGNCLSVPVQLLRHPTTTKFASPKWTLVSQWTGPVQLAHLAMFSCGFSTPTEWATNGSLCCIHPRLPRHCSHLRRLSWLHVTYQSSMHRSHYRGISWTFSRVTSAWCWPTTFNRDLQDDFKLSWSAGWRFLL